MDHAYHDGVVGSVKLSLETLLLLIIHVLLFLNV